MGDNCPGAPAFFGTDRDRVLGLAIASAVIIAVSMSFRLLMAVRQVYRGRSDIRDWSDWMWVIMGLIGATIDPWNGALVSILLRGDGLRIFETLTYAIEI